MKKVLIILFLIIGTGVSAQTSIPEESSIEFPNVFSPNADNKNDLFYFPNTGISELECQVYNRWGALVFQSNQINLAWNGRTTAGEHCPEGTYFYIVSYKTQGPEWEKHTGHVTLLR